jgi:uncharacterized membrane protein
MGKGRLEAFSDGVIAIIITVMVLELKLPEGDSPAALMQVLPHIGIYVLSFVYAGIYWNNHHHLFQAVKSVNGAVLWSNLHLLFWLSLTPFTSAWMGESHFAPLPVAAYGGALLMCALAYTILVRVLIAHDGQDSLLARAIGRDAKGWISLACYAAGLACAAVLPLLSVGFYALVAAIWLIPDRRIEKILH